MNTMRRTLGVIGTLAIFVGCPSKDPDPSPPDSPADTPPPTFMDPPAGEPAKTSGPVSIEGAPELKEVIKLESPDVPELEATVFVDVHRPAPVWFALKKNAWLKDTLSGPLGRGFVGSWYGFFASQGEALSARFTGTVLDYLVSKVLTAPLRVVWMGSDRKPGTPVLVVPSPGDGVKTALSTLHEVAGRGRFEANGCPGVDSEVPNPIPIARWVIADRAVYVTEYQGRIVVGRYPSAALHGACLPKFELSAPEGVDVEVGFVGQTFDRGVQALSQAMGFADVPRLAFGVEGDVFAPRGIVAKLGHSEILAQPRPSTELLQLVPESTPVFLTMALDLPKKIGPKALGGLFKGKLAKERSPVQIAVLWKPHGSPLQEEEIAIVWSRTEDEPALRSWFNQRPFSWGTACDHLVMSTSRRLFKTVKGACEKSEPSIHHAAPAVAKGFAQQTSVGLGVHWGRLTKQVFWDAYRREKKKRAAAPKEVEAAAKALEALPFFGWTGTVKQNALVPGGFRS